MSELRFTADCEVPEELKKYLRAKCGVSHGLLRKLKNREGGITVNGEPARTVDKVSRGDTIILHSDETGGSVSIVPNGGLSAKIVCESEHFAVFDKPAGMPVHPSVRHRDDTLANLFAYLYPDCIFRAVNRLDKDTSGLCVVAKNAYAARFLQGNCEKVYYAAVHGQTADSGTIDAPIARERESIIVRCVRADGQRAVTHYRKIGGNAEFSLLEIHLETGRTHQIRVHFSHIGHPLAGDDLYGGERSKIARQALHCGEMRFRSPETGEEITVRSELPEDIKRIL